ncbi:MAG: hypothetical protein AAB581_04345 [Patescibacteria group bacterium]
MKRNIQNIFGFWIWGLVGILVFGFGAFGVAHAQTEQPPIGLDEFSAPSVEILVSFSGTIGSTAALTAHTTNIDDNTVVFLWYVDDKPAPLASGKAKTTFSFQATKSFHLVKLEVSQDGAVITQNSVSVSSFNVAVLWSADTFVPAEYEGKALPVVGSRVTVTAIPSVRDENPEDLLYTWYLDAESQVRGVVGEQDFSFTAPRGATFVSIIVEVTNAARSVSVERGITIPIARPQVVLYQNSTTDPAFVSAGGTVAVRALPYYFRVASAHELAYAWEFADKTAQGVPPDPDTLTLAVPANSASGMRMLNVSVKNQRLLGENGHAELEVYIL